MHGNMPWLQLSLAGKCSEVIKLVYYYHLEWRFWFCWFGCVGLVLGTKACGT